MRAIHTTYDRYSDPDIYQSKMVLGGVLDVNIYQYLPQPSFGRGFWKMKYDYS